MAILSPSRATIRTKLSLGFAAAFALVVAVALFGVSQLHSVNHATRESREVWLPKIEALNRMKAAIGEHRLLATRQAQTTNFRHLAVIAKDMEAMRAIVDGEAEAYSLKAERGVERNVLSDFRSLWARYKDTLKSVEQRLEIGEITAAFTEFETLSLQIFDQAAEQLALLNAVARQRSKGAEVHAQDAYDFALA